MRLVFFVVASAALACSDVGLPCTDASNCTPAAPLCVDGACAVDVAGADGGGVDGGVDDGCGASTPLLAAREIAVGFDRSCALDCAGRPVCWGEGAETTPSTSATLHGLIAGSGFACGLDDGDALHCWGDLLHGVDEPPDGGARFDRIAAGQAHACGLVDGALACWGNLEYGGTFVMPTAAYDDVAAGYAYVCAHRLDDDTTDCGGGPFRPVAPDEVLTHVDVGSRWGCGLDASSHIACFGEEGAVVDGVPTQPVVSLGIGDGCSCAIDADGALVCWQDPDVCPEVVGSIPAGTFRAVAVATAHACAIRDDDAVICWGDDAWGRASVPARVAR